MEKTGTPIGGYAPDFELPGTDGSVHHLARYLEKFRAVGVIVMCNHCPYVQMYIDRLKQIQSAFQTQSFTLVGINGNDDDLQNSFEQMKAFATERQLNFPYLRDVTQDVVQSLGATRTPEVFLLDQAGILRYCGSIDDNPQNSQAVQAHYLRDAIVQLLSGTEVTPSFTAAIGCSVKWRQ
jgi:peroxiredoxin